MEKTMLKVHAEKIGELALIECEGRIVQSDAAFKLRNAVNSQKGVRIIVLDLTEVPVIDGGGLGMLVYLQRWAFDHNMRLKLFNPHRSVRDRLKEASSMREFDIASLDELTALMGRAESHFSMAA
jgi:anti-anti-sigma regulatory factor